LVANLVVAIAQDGHFDQSTFAQLNTPFGRMVQTEEGWLAQEGVGGGGRGFNASKGLEDKENIAEDDLPE